MWMTVLGGALQCAVAAFAAGRCRRAEGPSGVRAGKELPGVLPGRLPAHPAAPRRGPGSAAAATWPWPRSAGTPWLAPLRSAAAPQVHSEPSLGAVVKQKRCLSNMGPTKGRHVLKRAERQLCKFVRDWLWVAPATARAAAACAAAPGTPHRRPRGPPCRHARACSTRLLPSTSRPHTLAQAAVSAGAAHAASRPASFAAGHLQRPRPLALANCQQPVHASCGLPAETLEQAEDIQGHGPGPCDAT
jgi:hypothetical protein